MSVTTVDLHVGQLKQDLANGLSWLEKDDIGMGSIQAKYNGSDIQIMTIKKHPKLIGLEPTQVIFRVIDDEQEERNGGNPPDPNKDTYPVDTTTKINKITGSDTEGGGSTVAPSMEPLREEVDETTIDL